MSAGQPTAPVPLVLTRGQEAVGWGARGKRGGMLDKAAGPVASGPWLASCPLGAVLGQRPPPPCTDTLHSPAQRPMSRGRSVTCLALTHLAKTQPSLLHAFLLSMSAPWGHHRSPARRLSNAGWAVAAGSFPTPSCIFHPRAPHPARGLASGRLAANTSGINSRTRVGSREEAQHWE